MNIEYAEVNHFTIYEGANYVLIRDDKNVRAVLIDDVDVALAITESLTRFVKDRLKDRLKDRENG